MTACPDWTALVAHRFERAGGEPAGWQSASEHAESCPHCRRAAVAADPTLVFRRLAVKDAPARDSRDLDVAAMRQAVATLRRTRALAPVRRPTPWRWAAAAALPLLGLLLPAALDRPETANSARQAVLSGGGAQAFVAARVQVPSAELAALPLVDDLNRPQARVYELGGPDLAVVMIVDETLDV